MIKSIDLGVERGLPFAMAFLFTRKGVAVYTGSFNRIVAGCSGLEPCHGIVHTYAHDMIRKTWHMFGKGGYTLRYESTAEPFSKRPGRRHYILNKNGVKIAKFRKLPSCYLRQLNAPSA